MSELTIKEMMFLQKNLWEKHRSSWLPMEPAYARESFLFMMEEVGEVIAVIKKKGDDEIMKNPAVRRAFIEEMSDVMMYYLDTLLRYHVSEEEFSDVYRSKYNRNLQRDFEEEYQNI